MGLVKRLPLRGRVQCMPSAAKVKHPDWGEGQTELR